MPAIDPDDLPEKISSPPPSHLPIPTKVSHVWMSFSGTSTLGGPVIIPPPSLAVLEGDTISLTQLDAGKNQDDHRPVAETKKPPVPMDTGGSGLRRVRALRRYCSRA
jgi:hypothetical protein